MSQIFKQSLKSSIYSYIGVLIGFLNTSIIMPRIFTTTELGILGLIKSYGMILTSIFSFGFPVVIVRLFPRFKDELKMHNGFGTVLLLVALVSSILLIVFFPLLQLIIEFNASENAPQFIEFIPYILYFSVTGVFFIFLEYYSNSLKKSTLGSFYKDLIQRIFILISIGLYAYFSLRFDLFIQLYIASIASATILIYLQLAISKSFTFKINWAKIKAHSKEALSVASYGFATNIGSILVISIDSIMIAFFWPSSDVGIYTTVFFFASLMLVPARSLSKIGNTFISEYFDKKDLKGVESIYMKSCLNQGVVGVFMFFNLIILLPLVFVVLPKEFEVGKWVVFFIGLGNLAKLSTGLNIQIISFSNYYKTNSFLMLGYVLAMISINMITIPKLGITGAALASFISSLVYYLSASFYLYKKFNYSIVNKNLFSPFALAACFGVPLFLLSNYLDHPMIAIGLSASFSLLIGKIFYYKKVSPEINQQLKSIFQKYFKKDS